MFPLVTFGMTEASTTLSASVPCTPMDDGSTTDMASRPRRAVPDGWSAVSASRATQSRISVSLCTWGPGESSPAL